MARKRRPRQQPITSAVKRQRRYQRWRRWLKRIEGEVTQLAIDRHVYREVTAMVKANPVLQTASTFYDWMHRAYIETMTIRVRRLVDWDKRSVSFVQLMEEILDHPEVLSRRRFVRLYRPELRELAEHDFDRFTTPGGTRVSRRIIRRHRRDLVTVQQRLRRFVNRHVAHLGRRRMRRLPTFSELDRCVDRLEELLKEYLLLVEAQGLVEVLPTWQYDWKAPFRVPWITPAAPPPPAAPLPQNRPAGPTGPAPPAPQQP